MIKIYNIILSYLEENQKPFFGSVIIFFLTIYPATCIFQHGSGHKYQEPEILNTLRLVYF